MIDESKAAGVFDKMRQATRRKSPLSFADLSATILDAQNATGFVDTLSMEKPTVAESDLAIASTAMIPSDDIARQADVREQDVLKPVEVKSTAKADLPSPEPITELECLSGGLSARRGRVRAPVVQCNLKISEELRDALHLQALRERRTIADLVTEVMTGYLAKQGTFERLRR
jgi:hypothetical protein